MEQFNKLSEVLMDEHKRKSDLLRKLIHDYLQSHYNKTEGRSKV